MEKFFIGIYNYFAKNRAVYVICFALSFLLVSWFASRLTLEEDISKVIPKDKKIEKLNEVFQNSKFLDKLVITVSLADTASAAKPDELVAYAGSFTASVQSQLGPMIGKFDVKVDEELALDFFNTISDNLPVYLDEKDYASIDTLVQPSKIKETLEANFRTLTSPAGIGLKTMIAKDPVGISFIALKKLQQLQYDENFELYEGYVMTRDHKNLLMFITPAFPPNNTGKNAELISGIDKISDSLAAAYSQRTQSTYFGAAAVSVGNALQLRRDTFFTQGITIAFLVVFIGAYFRKKRAPFIILVPVAFGALFSLAVIYFIKGSISVIALATGSVVLGIAVGYSLHLFNHYRHVGNIREVIRDLVFPLTIGSLTTIGGFLCLEFVESEMLRDLGLFAAFSLVGASLCSLIFLPHLISSRSAGSAPVSLKPSLIDRLASYRPEHNPTLVFFILALTILFAFTARKVTFESDLMGMNYMSARLKQSEKKLNELNVFSLQSVYLVSEGRTLDEALMNNEKLAAGIEKLQAQGVIKKYSGVSSLVISDSLQKRRIERWNQYWTAGKKNQLLATLQAEGSRLKFNPSAFDNFRTLLDKNFQPATGNPGSSTGAGLLGDFITEKPGHSTVVTLVKTSPEHKPAVYATFENNPLVTVIDRQYLAGRFVDIINADFSRIAWMSSLLVFTVLLITYGRIELTLVSFIPMFITWIWILGIMGIAGIHFNIINIIISALIFGLGDDYSLFIMDGLLQEYKTGRKNLASYKSSIFLSAITTIAGLGVLIFAKHPALKSIALISIIGILCVVVISQILIPFFFAVFIKNRALNKKFPWTLWGFLKSVFAFCYFLFGSMLLTILGFVLLRINPFKNERAKGFYHKVLATFCRSMIYIMSNVKKQVLNPLKEDFSKPCVIISNHQSFLDILATVMLHPKLILLTNEWVWKSPVFGAVVRMADYYPVMQGAESSIDLLESKIKEGYSIVVFPEGTRSIDERMKRFHKGAFYLAEKLGLDILPIVIHGTGYTMSKGDFLLKDGTITLKFLPRISQDDLRWGEGYAERVKTISRSFKEEYYCLKKEVEKPAYFRERLIYNFLYKGPVLEWYMKVKVRLENHYQLFHDLLPYKGKMLDIGCGYGFMSYILHFASPMRQITGIDYDDNKIATANHCFDKNDNINFETSDVMEYEFEKYDAIILADVLHYLQPESQEQVVNKCISNLLPGGTIVIRDGNKDLKDRHQGTRLTEFFSTRFTGFNKTTGNGLSYLSGEMIRNIAAVQNVSCRVIDNTKYTSNVIFVLTKPKHVEAV